MRHALYVVIPVTVVQICDKASRSLGQVIRIFLDAAVIREALDEDHLAAIGREKESLDVDLAVGHLHATSTVGIHLPQLSVAKEGDLLAALDPCGICLAFAVLGQGCCLCNRLAGFQWLHEEHRVAFVFLDTIVAHLIDQCLAVGRDSIRADASHGPKSLRRHLVAGERDIVFLNHRLCFHRWSAKKHGTQHHCYCFIHGSKLIIEESKLRISNLRVAYCQTASCFVKNE